MNEIRTVVLSVDMTPYRQWWMDNVSDSTRLATKAVFAEMVMEYILRNQFLMEVDVSRLQSGHHWGLRANVDELVNHVSVPKLWSSLSRVICTQPNYIIHDIHYRRAGERFIIKGVLE